MEWTGRQESTNVDDRRGIGPAGLAIGGGGSILVVLLALVLGVDPRDFLGGGGQGIQQQQGPADPEEENLAKFTKVVFRDTEEVWDEQFRQLRQDYRKPTLVLYTQSVQSGCGNADSSVGPFYCPADAKVYIDLTFYKDMERQLKAGGEFARAYVIAHEVGHHVQRLLGYSTRVDEARRSGNKVEANRMSVRLELQADYLAGVWAHHGQRKYKFLERGDIESAMNAANAIGDDRLQKRGRGSVNPDSFTHGTSKQRMRWFREGFDSGDVRGARRLFDLRYEEL